jgi:uncharacterized SAM-binding protein YcdF (DUF218 family)
VTLALLASFRRLGPGKSGASAFAAFALLIWGASCLPAADFLTARLEAGLSPPASPRGDVIVVLGCGVHEGVPDLAGAGVPREEAQARLLAAARLHRRLGLPVVVAGGSPIAGRPPEAPLMKRMLTELGVPPGKILVEAESRDTFGNALGVRRILEAEGYRTALLVTSAYHMKRAAFQFAGQGVDVVPVPVQFRTRPGRRYFPQDWLPSADASKAVADAGREFLGMAWYRLAPGGIGTAGTGRGGA